MRGQCATKRLTEYSPRRTVGRVLLANADRLEERMLGKNEGSVCNKEVDRILTKKDGGEGAPGECGSARGEG